MTHNQYAIIGGTIWGNRGAEAMVCTTIAHVRKIDPQSTIVLLSYYPTKDRELLKDPNIIVDSASPSDILLKYFLASLLIWIFCSVGIRLPESILPERILRLKNCKKLFDVSGISFHDGRLGVLIYNVFCIWPAMLLGVPVLHLSQARGPFNNPLNKFLSKTFLSQCEHVYSRGRITSEFMQQLKLPSDRWGQAADIAFSFQSGMSLTSENKNKLLIDLDLIEKLKASNKRIVALSPSSVVYQKAQKLNIDYIDLLVNLVLYLNKEGFCVVILPNATREGHEGGRNNDLFVINLIKKSLKQNKQTTQTSIWIDYDLNTDGIRDIISKTEFLITSRFHAMIAGLSLGVPTFVIGWSHKYQEVLEMFECQKSSIGFDELSANLNSKVEEFITLKDFNKKLIEKNINNVRLSSGLNFERILHQ